MIKNFVLLASLFLFFPDVFAQKNEWKGYYIDQHADTVRGVFNQYKQRAFNPDKVSFISAASGDQLQLTPVNCSAFTIENSGTYVSYRGTRMTNPVGFSTAAEMDTEDTYDTVTVFLRQFASTDKYRFYVYQDKLRINLFYSGSGEVMTELLQKSAVRNNSYWNSMVYRQQLKDMFPVEKAGEIDRLSYSEESLAAFTDRLNGSKYARSTGNKQNGLVVLGGLSFNTFKFRSDKSLDFSTRNYSSGQVPVAGMGYIISLNRNYSNIFLFPQIKIYSYKHTATTRYGNPYPAIYNVFKSSPVISLGFNFGYTIINKANLSVSIAPGGGFTFLAKNKQADEYRASATETKTVVTSMDNATSLINGQVFIVMRKKYMIWSSYQLPAPVTSYVSATGRLSSFQCGLGFRL